MWKGEASVWKAPGEGIVRSSRTGFSAMVWPRTIGCGIYCKYFVINSGKIPSFVSALKILNWLPTAVNFQRADVLPPGRLRRVEIIWEDFQLFFPRWRAPALPWIFWKCIAGAAYFKTNSASSSEKPNPVLPCFISSVACFLKCKQETASPKICRWFGEIVDPNIIYK